MEGHILLVNGIDDIDYKSSSVNVLLCRHTRIILNTRRWYAVNCLL